MLATLDTDKVSMDIKYPNKTPGVVKEYKAAEGDTVTVGQLFAVIEESEGGAAPAKKEEAPKEEAPKEEVPKKEAPKKEETKKEEPKKASPPPKKPEPASKPAAAPGGAPLSSGPRPERRVKMTRLRARVAERLKNAQNTYALLTTFNEVDMTALMDLRKAHKDAFLEKHGVKLGFMSAFVKAAANALETVPAVNAVIDGGDIIYRDYYDISVAVATPKGLVVPVLRNVDAMSFATVEKTINELGKKARDGALSIDEMAGGTFTISNGGVFGSMLSTPIINPPQSAILGMHATNMKPAVVDGQIVARCAREGVFLGWVRRGGPVTMQLLDLGTDADRLGGATHMYVAREGCDEGRHLQPHGMRRTGKHSLETTPLGYCAARPPQLAPLQPILYPPELQASHVPGTDLRPPPHRRARGGHLPQAHQGGHRGPPPPAAGCLRSGATGPDTHAALQHHWLNSHPRREADAPPSRHC